MSNPIRRFCFSIIIVCSSIANANWMPIVHNFSTDEYGAGTQNWQILQHSNGWIYAANNYGLLQYDGNRWNLYGIANSTVVRAIAIDSLGQIYAGGTDEIGFFRPNQLGQLDYFSLVDSIPQRYRNFGEVWKIFWSNDCLYVQTRNYIFLFHKNASVEVIDPGDVIRTSILLNHSFYVATSRGIYVLSANRLHALRGSEQLLGTTVCALLPSPSNPEHLLIATDFRGLYLYDGNDIQRKPLSIDKYLIDNQLYTVTTNQHNIAFGTVQNGLIITDSVGNNPQFITRETGLQNSTVLSLSFDSYSNLWVGLDCGIACVRRDKPIYEFIDSKIDLNAGYASCEYDGKLYFGTNQGLYKYTPTTKHLPSADISFVAGSSGQVWDVCEFNGDLLCAHNRGLFHVKNDAFIPIETSDGFWSVKAWKDNIAIAGTYTGFFIIKKDHTNWYIRHLDGFEETALYYEIDAAGNIWILTHRGVERLKVDERTYSIQSDIIIEQNAAQQVFTINKLHENILITSDSYMGMVQPSGELVSTTSQQLGLPFQAPYLFIKQHHNNIWFACNENIYLLTAEGKLIPLMTYNKFIIGGFSNISVDAQGNAIIGGMSGFRKIITDEIKQNTSDKLDGYIRSIRITSPEQKVIYGEPSFSDIQQIQLPAATYSMRVDFANNNVLDDNTVQYRTRLYPIEKEFSAPTSNPYREYTALTPGKYQLQVEISSRNKTIVRQLNIKINQLWYHTYFAKLFYLFAIILFIIAVVYYTKRHYKRKQLRMEEEKQLQLHQQQLQILQLENERAQFDLRQKSQELSNILLSELTRKELTNDILTDVRRCMDLINQGNVVDAKIRMQTLQNRLSAASKTSVDWKRFEENFDIVNDKFLQRLKDKYPWMNKQERRLCVYIKMGLITKEIAPLMNLSTRSIEMMRYRLRAKMQLDQQSNLKAFFEQL